MKIFRKQRRGSAALLLGLFLSLQAMAVCPALHALAHPDSSHPDHECVVTHFARGQVNAPSIIGPVFRAPVCLVFSQAPPRIIFVSADVRLLPGRGPPACAVLT